MAEVETGGQPATHPAITVRDPVSMTQVAARKGARSLLSERAQAAWGIALPSRPTLVEFGTGTMVIWTGPEQWLVVGQPTPGGDQYTEISGLLKGLASVVDVTDVRVIFRVAGRKPLASLQRSLPIDLDESAFRPGDVAVTQAAHLGFLFWRSANGEAYEFACARTYAMDFRQWLTAACGSLAGCSD